MCRGCAASGGSRRTQPANRIHPGDHVTAGVRIASLADRGRSIGIGQEIEGFFQPGEIVGAHQDRCRPSVSRDRHPLVFTLDSVQDIAEVIPHLTQGLKTTMTQL